MKHLGQKILSLSSLVSSSADTSSLPGASLLLTGGMFRTCHGCHAPLDDDHKDYPSGWQKCPLDHWTGCKGGIVEGKAGNGSEWRGCPVDYVYVEAVSDDEDLDEGLEKTDIIVNTQEGTDKVTASALVDELCTNLESVKEATKKASSHEVVDEDSIIRQLEEANK